MIKIIKTIAGTFGAILLLAALPIYYIFTYLFPEIAQKWDQELSDRIDNRNALVEYARKHTVGGVCEYAKTPLGRRMYEVITCGGGEFLCGSKDVYTDWSDEWFHEFLRIMEKYRLDFLKNPTAEMYEAFRIELDPEYKGIVDKVNEGLPLTESERALYEEIHYQKEA